MYVWTSLALLRIDFHVPSGMSRWRYTDFLAAKLVEVKLGTLSRVMWPVGVRVFNCRGVQPQRLARKFLQIFQRVPVQLFSNFVHLSVTSQEGT
jgi:hypothetical protein